MSVTCGFFNSVNHDRRYEAVQFGRIFDGVIVDGVLMSVGNRLMVRATENNNMNVIVGSGRAWFEHIWILNDADVIYTIDEAEAVMSRIDAIAIKIDHSDSVRDAGIVVVKGVPGANPEKPALENTGTVFYHPLAYITVGPDATNITQSEIENAVGTTRTPFATAPLEKIDADELISQWQSQFTDMMNVDSTRFSNFLSTSGQTFTDMLEDDQEEFLKWLATIQDIFIDEGVAERLAMHVYNIYEVIQTLRETGSMYDAIQDENGDAILMGGEEDDIIIEGATVFVHAADYDNLAARVSALERTVNG